MKQRSAVRSALTCLRSSSAVRGGFILNLIRSEFEVRPSSLLVLNSRSSALERRRSGIFFHARRTFLQSQGNKPGLGFRETPRIVNKSKFARDEDGEPMLQDERGVAWAASRRYKPWASQDGYLANAKCRSHLVRGSCQKTFMRPSASSSTGKLDGAAVHKMLLSSYKLQFEPMKHSSLRTDPIRVTSGTVENIGSHFKLMSYDDLANQMTRALVVLNTEFIKCTPDFRESLQLLRLVAAPGLGKSTALSQLWSVLYRKADLQFKKGNEISLLASLRERVKTSLSPSCTMAVILDLQHADLSMLSEHEERLEMKQVLALRMLYCSLRLNVPRYSVWLEAVDRQLRRSITPLQVLRFWQEAATMPSDKKWMVVFAIDEANANVSSNGPGKPSVVARLLSEFITFREEAAKEEAQGGMACMPVLIVASSSAPAASLAGTTNSRSKVMDLKLHPLKTEQMRNILVDLMSRIAGAPSIDRNFPPQLLSLLHWSGGNGHLLASGLCRASSNGSTDKQVLEIVDPCDGTHCSWLDKDFDSGMKGALKSLSDATNDSNKWSMCVQERGSSFMKSLLAAHVLRLQVRRIDIVQIDGKPSSNVTWQELENKGMVYMVPVGSSRSSNEIVTGQYPDVKAEFYINVAPLLLIAAQSQLQFRHGNTNLSFASLAFLQNMDNLWHRQGAVDCTAIMLKLFFFRNVLKRCTVSLRELLGVTSSTVPHIKICVPDSYSRTQLEVMTEYTKQSKFIEMMCDADKGGRWLFVGSDSDVVDGWIFLKDASTKKMTVLLIHSRKRGQPESFSRALLETKRDECWEVPELEGVPIFLYITDRDYPKRERLSFKPPPNVLPVTAPDHQNFYGAGIANLLKDIHKFV